jgi:hypothetical protein
MKEKSKNKQNNKNNAVVPTTKPTASAANKKKLHNNNNNTAISATIISNQQPGNEMDVLRKDCKSLLFSLQKHQSILNESLTKVAVNSNHQNPTKKSQIASSQRATVSSANHRKSSKTPTASKISITPTAKTVSFSDCPRISQLGTLSMVSVASSARSSSSQRRPRSISPLGFVTGHGFNNPAKSILKKQLVQDVLSDPEGDQANLKSHSFNSITMSMTSSASTSATTSRSQSANSVSTGSLLASDIYGNGSSSKRYVTTSGNLDTGYEENLTDLVKHRNFQSSANLNTFIDYIDQKRQSYLNHSYRSASCTNLASDSFLFAKSVNEKQHSATGKSKTGGASYAKPTLSSLNMSKSAVAKQLPSSPGKTGNCKSPLVSSLSSSAALSAGLLSVAATAGQKKRNYKKMAKWAKKNKPLLGFDYALGNYEL